jgi:hypothetical protein
VQQEPSWEAKALTLRAVGCIAVVAAAISVDEFGMNCVRKETV